MLPDGTVNPGEMTSFNHYTLGAVAGLTAASPGYRDIVFRPRPGGGITWAGAAHESPYGRVAIRSELHATGIEVQTTGTDRPQRRNWPRPQPCSRPERAIAAARPAVRRLPVSAWADPRCHPVIPAVVNQVAPKKLHNTGASADEVGAGEPPGVTAGGRGLSRTAGLSMTHLREVTSPGRTDCLPGLAVVTFGNRAGTAPHGCEAAPARWATGPQGSGLAARSA